MFLDHVHKHGHRLQISYFKPKAYIVNNQQDLDYFCRHGSKELLRFFSPKLVKVFYIQPITYVSKINATLYALVIFSWHSLYEVSKNHNFKISVQKTNKKKTNVIRIGGFPMEIKTKIRYLIISCYHKVIHKVKI